MNIPINIETLLAGKVVETERIEFKKSWNPATTMRTISAFANDFENLGSGYVVVGVEEQDGMPVRPVHGFPPNQFDAVQKDLLGYCNLIRPAYFPRVSLEEIDGKHVLLIWATAGSNRPYEAPKDVEAKKKEYQYYIRRFSNTVQANREQRQELLSLTANIPFDDRQNTQTSINDISLTLVKQHLKEIGSRFYEESSNLSHREVCVQMNLAEGANEHTFPKNVGLLMFNEHPEQFFPFTQINLTEFPEGLAGKEFIEKTFTGTIQQQLKDALAYLKSQVLKSKTVKFKGEAESETYVNYPFEALEEALANAVYHKNYEIREPIEVRVLPEAIEIISFGGPDPSIRDEDLDRGVIRARRYRNRRIGEFLKELNLTEGKGTGIPTIKRALALNGSLPAKYDTDGEDRRFFIVEIPIHPEFMVRDGNQVKVLIDKEVEVLNKDRNQDRNQVRNQVGNQVGNHAIDRIVTTLRFCTEPKTKNEILDKIGLSIQSKYFIENIGPAIEAGLIEMTIPDKPTSKNQKYVTTEKGKKVLNI
ncbi:RNA-binding domain-containing protein [uncultured Draconibacterium sp.]|uniref:RNA-binding domain-containing protein n=1 Tax=uncultured Draconibacterium sp. TaxID=1573823 RepID=UPI0029C89990|nr:RNA-binding domain-containing protein [uncultured Draconibacterium sp.]